MQMVSALLNHKWLPFKLGMEKFMAKLWVQVENSQVCHGMSQAHEYVHP